MTSPANKSDNGASVQPDGSVTACKHDTWRHAQTYPPDPRSMTVQRMEWCGTCGKLLDDREWKIPLPPEAESPNVPVSEDADHE